METEMRLHPKEQKICLTPFGPLKQGLGLSKLLEKDGTANNKYINKSDLMSILFSQ